MCPIERILRSYPSSGTSCRLSAVEKAYFAVLSALGGCVDDHCKVGSLQGCAADQAEEVCGQIRKVIGEVYGEAIAEATTVQYGGSMNAKNCEELLSKKDVDGGLIGGASLKAPDFAVIVNAATKG